MPDIAETNIRISATDDTARALSGMLQNMRSTAEAVNAMWSKGINSEIERTINRLQDLSKKAEEEVGRKTTSSFQKAAGAVSSLAQGVVGLVGAGAIEEFVRRGVSGFMNFEDAITRARQEIKLTDEQMKTVTETVERIRQKTGASKEELVSQLRDFLALSGAQTDEGIKLYERLQAIARATGVSFDTISKGAISALKQLKVPLDEVEGVVAQWATTMPKAMLGPFLQAVPELNKLLEQVHIGGKNRTADLAAMFATLAEKMGDPRLAADALKNSLSEAMDTSTRLGRMMIPQMAAIKSSSDPLIALYDALLVKFKELGLLGGDETARIKAQRLGIPDETVETIRKYGEAQDQIRAKLTSVAEAIAQITQKNAELDEKFKASATRMAALIADLGEKVGEFLNTLGAPKALEDLNQSMKTLNEVAHELQAAFNWELDWKKLLNITGLTEEWEHIKGVWKGREERVRGEGAPKLFEGEGGGPPIMMPTPFQHGGIVSKPTLAMLGEAGAEAVVPLTGARGGGGESVEAEKENTRETKSLTEELRRLNDILEYRGLGAAGAAGGGADGDGGDPARGTRGGTRDPSTGRMRGTPEAPTPRTRVDGKPVPQDPYVHPATPADVPSGGPPAQYRPEYHAEGGDVTPGKPAVVGEKGPEIVLPRPRTRPRPAPAPAPAPVAPTIVGEKGPELIMPRSQGRVIPAAETASLRRVGAKHGLTPQSIAGLISVESGWSTGATGSHGKYRGLTQIGQQTFREAGGKLGGLTWSEYLKASPAKQIDVYGAWLDHYKFDQKVKAAGVDLSKMSHAEQAAFLQAMQFSPNANEWMKDPNTRATLSSQARVLGDTSRAQMAAYYKTILPAGGGQPTQYASGMDLEGDIATRSRTLDVARIERETRLAGPTGMDIEGDPATRSRTLEAAREDMRKASLAPVDSYKAAIRRGERGEFNAARTGEFGKLGSIQTKTITLSNGQSVKVNALVADRYEGFLNEMIERGYPVDVRGGGGYNPRAIAGTRTPSMHAYGTAVDINVKQNPQHGRTNLPSSVEAIAWQHGLSWGGRFGDPMHFEAMGAQAWASKKRQLETRAARAESRQGGGPVGAGSSYLVGEEGPELFSPSLSGGIISNDQINMMRAQMEKPIKMNVEAPSIPAYQTRAQMARSQRRVERMAHEDQQRDDGKHNPSFLGTQ